jgi:predicted lipoprotein
MRRTLFAIILTAVVVLVSCKRGGGEDGAASSSGGVDAGGFDKSALLRAFGQCAFETFRDFRTAAVDLDAATQQAANDGTPASRDAAREAWKKTIDAWQKGELMGFGPTALTGSPGGKDLRDPIYAWPLVNRCLIEQQLVDKTYERPELATALVNTRGLAAAEYLLFYDGTDNACTPTASINASGTWAALGAPEIQQRKSAYARALAADTRRRADELVAAWDPAQGNFVSTMATAGSNDVFTTQQMAFNAVSNAFFYIDDALKTMKLAKPAGFVPGCTAPPCLADVESPWAKRSKEHIKNNLIGFDRLLRGCAADGSGLGWDDLLTAVGDAAFVQKLVDATNAARAAADALQQPTLEDDLVNDKAGVQRLYDALRAIVAVLKTEFISVLDLELPKRVEGDND